MRQARDLAEEKEKLLWEIYSGMDRRWANISVLKQKCLGRFEIHGRDSFINYNQPSDAKRNIKNISSALRLLATHNVPIIYVLLLLCAIFVLGKVFLLFRLPHTRINSPRCCTGTRWRERRFPPLSLRGSLKGVESKKECLKEKFFSMCLSHFVGSFLLFVTAFPICGWENEKLYFCKMYVEYNA